MAKKPIIKSEHVFTPQVRGVDLPIYQTLEGRVRQFSPKPQASLEEIEDRMRRRKYLHQAKASTLQNQYNACHDARRFMLLWSKERGLTPRERQRAIDSERGFD